MTAVQKIVRQLIQAESFKDEHVRPKGNSSTELDKAWHEARREHPDDPRIAGNPMAHRNKE